jgi:hypothetical protein
VALTAALRDWTGAPVLSFSFASAHSAASRKNGPITIGPVFTIYKIGPNSAYRPGPVGEVPAVPGFDPGFVLPGFVVPGFVVPGFVVPGFVAPGFVDPPFGVVPGFECVDGMVPPFGLSLGMVPVLGLFGLVAGGFVGDGFVGGSAVLPLGLVGFDPGAVDGAVDPVGGVVVLPVGG